MKRILISLLGITGIVLFVFSVIYGSLQIEGYNHISQYISESYATGVANNEVTRFYGYIPAGILLALFCWSAIPYLPKTKLIITGMLGLGILYGIGTVLVAGFPCDPGCPMSGDDVSLSQAIHNFSGGIMYALAPLCLFAIGYGLMQVSHPFARLTLVAAICAAIFSYAILLNPTSSHVGLTQRLAELSYLSWFGMLAWHLPKRAFTA